MKVLMLCVVLVVLSTALVAFADDTCEMIYPDVPPQIVNGRTLLPMRAIFEWLGAKVTWEASEKHIKAWREDITVHLWVGKRTYLLEFPDGEQKRGKLDVAPQVIKERTFVPLRFVAEAMQCKVTYKGKEKLVQLKTPEGRCGLVFLQ